MNKKYIIDTKQCNKIKSYKDCKEKKKCRWKDKKCVVKSPHCTRRKYYESCVKDNLCYWDKNKCSSKKITGPKSKITGPKSKITGPESKITGPKSKITGPESKITGPKSKNTGPESKITGPKLKNTGPKSKNISRNKYILQEKIDDYVFKNLIGTKKSLEALGLILHKMIDLYIYNRRLQNNNSIRESIKINKTKLTGEKEQTLRPNPSKYIIKKKSITHGNDLNNDYNSERTMPLNRWRPQILNLNNNFNNFSGRNDDVENRIETNRIENIVSVKKRINKGKKTNAFIENDNNRAKNANLNSNQTVLMNK
jgi:hypothetical protein